MDDLGGDVLDKKRFAHTALSIPINDDAVVLETMTFDIHQCGVKGAAEAS